MAEVINTRMWYASHELTAVIRRPVKEFGIICNTVSRLMPEMDLVI